MPIIYNFNEGNSVLFETWPEVNRACQDRLGHESNPDSYRAVCDALEAAGTMPARES